MSRSYISTQPPGGTPAEQRMRLRLFGPTTRRLASTTDAEMWRVLGALRAMPDLAAFRIWLVGSRLDRHEEESDIDLVLSPAGEAKPSDSRIEHALWRCRDHGLHGADPPCLVDACFRASGPVTALAPLEPWSMLTTVKLYSPRLMKLVRSGQIGRHRRVGRFSLEYDRRAGETGFYGKLPERAFEGRDVRYLRPAVEIKGSR